MELPNLGKHCADKQCKLLDFLPLQCRCGQLFCRDHLNLHVQTCINSRFLTEDELKTIEDVFVCSEGGCKERSLVPLVCPICKRHYCVRHRHLSNCQESQQTLQAEKERYEKPKREFDEAKALVDEEVKKNLAEAKKKSKNRELAAKLQLMKIKNKAKGLKSIPPADRLYFNVHVLPKSQPSGRVTPLFVSKTWSLGRAIDGVAGECNLQNNNNKGPEKKLRLFRLVDNEVISDDLSASLDTLLSRKALVDGEDLAVEYVDDACTSLQSFN